MINHFNKCWNWKDYEKIY